MTAAVAAMCVFVLVLPAGAGLAPGKNRVMLRGEAQDIYFYPAAGANDRGSVLFAAGDGGWHGFAITTAQRMASEGYDVYGLDSKQYLGAFSVHAPLTGEQVASDLAELARLGESRPGRRFTLVGWSEGAGLALLAASADANRFTFNGLITAGLPEVNVLAWKWVDAVTYLTKRVPNEPTFSSAAYISKVSPLPLVMIQSSSDEYVSAEAAKRLFDSARKPKRFRLVTASNHHFGGNQEEFARAFQESLDWIQQTSR